MGGVNPARRRRAALRAFFASKAKNGLKMPSKLFLFLFAVFMPASVYAHPHIFLDASAKFVFDKEGLKGVRLKWIFDEMYGNDIMFAYDEDENKVLDKEEVKKIEKESFSNLKNFHYFTYLRKPGGKSDVRKVTDFTARFSKGRVVFEFFIPFEVKASTKYTHIEFANYDDTYYTDVAFVKNKPITFENAGAFDCSYRIVNDRKHTYYFGEIVPKAVKIKFRRKSAK